MTSKRFLCCTLESWATGAAWLQIILYGLTTTLVSAYTFFLIISFRYYDVEPLFWIITFLAAAILFSVFGILMGVYLLTAIQKKSSGNLTTWIIFTSVLTGLSIIGTGYRIACGDLNILTKMLGICINLFSIYIIYSHRQELVVQHQENQGRIHTVQFLLHPEVPVKCGGKADHV